MNSNPSDTTTPIKEMVSLLQRMLIIIRSYDGLTDSEEQLCGLVSLALEKSTKEQLTEDVLVRFKLGLSEIHKRRSQDSRSQDTRIADLKRFLDEQQEREYRRLSLESTVQIAAAVHEAQKGTAMDEHLAERLEELHRFTDEDLQRRLDALKQ